MNEDELVEQIVRLGKLYPLWKLAGGLAGSILPFIVFISVCFSNIKTPGIFASQTKEPDFFFFWFFGWAMFQVGNRFVGEACLEKRRLLFKQLHTLSKKNTQ